FRNTLTKEFARLYHDLEGGIDVVAFFNPYLPLPAFRRRDRARARMVELIAGIMAERRRLGREGEDFLDALMTARYADGRALTDEEVTGLLIALVFAGQHTSAVLSAWTGVLLLAHPEYLPALLEEQARVAPGDAQMSLPSLRALVHLERVIKEAERMHPPLIMLMRKVVRDFAAGDYVARAGTLAMVSPALSHRLPDVFTDPDRYDPD